MVVGETQILGQIKDSFLEAQQVKATGTIFNELFKQVITLANVPTQKQQSGKVQCLLVMLLLSLERKYLAS